MRRLAALLLLIALVAPVSLAGGLGVPESESGVAACCCAKTPAGERPSAAFASEDPSPCGCGCGMSQSDHQGEAPAPDLAISSVIPSPEREALVVLSGPETANSGDGERITRSASPGESPPEPALYLLVCSFLS